jgi:phosphohistidine swiveling domain-containing protein
LTNVQHPTEIAVPDVRFDLPAPEYAEHKWLLFDEHAPSAQTPLLDEGPFGAMGQRKPEDGVPRMIRVNCFTYMRGDVDVTTPFASISTVATRDELRLWRTKWLPEVDKVVSYLANFDPRSVPAGEWAATIEHQANEFRRVFGPIHRYAVGHAEVTARAFVKAYQETAGGTEADGRALLQGFPNASLDRASLIWDLSRTLRSNPVLVAAIEAGDSLPEGEASQQLAAVLDAYGDTTNSNNQDKPTWREGPSLVLTQALASVRQPDTHSPRALVAEQRKRREELEASLRGKAAADPAVAELLPLLEAAQEYLPNLEDHNYHVDQRLLAASRERYLAIGALLHERGQIGAADDVFYIYQDELVPALEQGKLPPQTELDRRREYVADCRQASPPPVLGKGATEADATTIKGIGASKGSYTGRARVIDSIEDASLLQPGEVLVCRATTPAWTPLFGVAGAVVTNAGGALSHTAIVAREFGIPAVLGTQNGSALIPDGATVTVDGTNGLVTIEVDT